MKKIIALGSLVLMAIPLQASATLIPAYSPTMGKPTIVDLGQFNAGTYLLTGSGTVDLTNGTAITTRPDGTPDHVVTKAGYSYFNPDGSFTADGKYGLAGTNAKIGALIGTLNANPTSANDWFLIGYSKQLTLGGTQHIYAAINDTAYPDNHGSYNVSVSVAAVPEPESCLLMFTGLAFMGLVARGKNKKVPSTC